MSVHVFPLPVSLRLALRFGVGVYILFIIWASLSPSDAGGAIPHMDKLLHLLVYAILGGAVTLAWPQLSKLRIFWGCFIFGAALEVGQGLMGAGRTASFYDGLANTLGVAIGVYTAMFILSKFSKE